MKGGGFGKDVREEAALGGRTGSGNCEALIHLTRAQKQHHIVQQCQQQIVQLS